MMHLYCFFPLKMKGNTQHLSFLAFHGQAAKHETLGNDTMMTKKTRQDEEILLLGYRWAVTYMYCSEGYNT